MGKTAKELSAEKLRAYRPWQALKNYQKDPAVAERRELAWKIARSAAEFLKRSYGAKRVFGSLAQKTMFTPWSDIDLAVWGVAPQDYYSAAGSAMDIGLEHGIRVDVIDPEDCRAEILAAIEREGIQL